MKLLEESPIAAKGMRDRLHSQARATSDPLLKLNEVFKLLADETRLRILRLLIDADEYHVRALCDKLGQSQPAVSHHLALLRKAGLIDCRRQGKHNFYHLMPQKFEELLDLVFVDKKPADRRIRVGKYLLSCEEDE